MRLTVRIILRWVLLIGPLALVPIKRVSLPVWWVRTRPIVTSCR